MAAVIIGLACSLLIDSRYPLVYVTAACLAVLSKCFITYKSRHYFNPANFGVVLALLLIPYHTTAMPALFGGFVTPSIIFFILGLITIIYAKQLAVPFAWLGGFFIFSFFRAWWTEGSLLFQLVPALSPTFILFTFHMISDPATTPQGTKHRILFGLLVALIDAGFRVMQVPYGNFYALFIMGSLLPVVRDYETKSN